MLLSLSCLYIKNWGKCIVLLGLLLFGGRIPAQTGFLTNVPPAERVQALWQYCDRQLISDQDSAITQRFLEAAAATADSLGDVQLKKYATYFQLCSSLLFSYRYERYFPEGDYRSAVAVFERAKTWASEKGYTEIGASCEHYAGQVYFRADQYGPAFDHMLKAQEIFRKLGYENVPNVSRYLLHLGLAYYRFEEWDKALDAFLTAIRYPFFLPREEINTYNTIALIYSRKKDWANAMPFCRNVIAKAAAYDDTVWVGIASGNLGTVFLQLGQNDSALFYHRINYSINSKAGSGVPTDAAFTALAMATAFVRKHQPDSALYYIRFGQYLSTQDDQDNAYFLEFRKRLLTVQMELHKTAGDYRTVSLLSDSLMIVKDSLQQLLDAKILSRAVQKAEAERYAAELKLLETEEDLGRLRFYIVIAMLLFIMAAFGLFFNRFRIRKQHQAQRAEQEKKRLSAEKIRAEESLKHAEELLVAYLTTIKEKTNLIENLDAELGHLKQLKSSENGLESVAANMEKLISSTILTDADWRRFRHLFDQVHPGFLYRLKEKFPDLSPAEMRLLILTKLKLPSREMAHMLGVSIDAVRKSRYRVRKKLNLESEKDLEEAIEDI